MAGTSNLDSLNCSSINDDEVKKFNGIQWWNKESGSMKPLISLNKLRVPFIRDGILARMNPSTPVETDKRLDGFRILDVGCGGGILSEGLGHLGALVVGIDPGKENVSIARNHLPVQMHDRVAYKCTTIEQYALDHEDSLFDAVVMSEVIEHVENPEEFIRNAVKLLKPNGSVFITTPNRTVASWLGEILMGEYILRILPVGTHEWKKFLKPKEIREILKKDGIRIENFKGITYNPINNVWDWTSITKVHYALHAVKNP